MKKSMLLTKILLGSSFLFVGCGGGGGGSTGTSTESTNLSQISGIVSDGPIKNARVFLDIDNNGQYTDGEPYDITDEDGRYLIKYVLDPGIAYVVIAEGNTTLGTEDTTSDNTGILNFQMFTSLKTTGAVNESISGKTYTKDLTPITFKNYLVELVTEVDSNTNLTEQEKIDVKDNLFIKSIIEDTSNNKQTIFQKILIDDSGTNNTSTIVKSAVDSLNAVIKNETPTLSGFTIIDNGLKDLLTNGDLNEDVYGIKSLINTKIAYEIANAYVSETNVSTNLDGIKKTITYEKNGDNITAIFKQIVATSSTNGSETSEYEGTVIFDINKNVLSAKYTQKHSITSNLDKKNRVDGVISITKTNSGTNLDFTKGEFNINTLEYGNIAGQFEISGASTQEGFGFNDNTIDDLSKIKIVTPIEPLKIGALYPLSLVGNWNGTLNSSCPSSTGEINLSFSSEYSASWQGSFGNSIYGTTLSVSGTTLTLNNDSTTWGTATVGTSTINGTWNDGTCNGTFEVIKEEN